FRPDEDDVETVRVSACGLWRGDPGHIDNFAESSICESSPRSRRAGRSLKSKPCDTRSVCNMGCAEAKSYNEHSGVDGDLASTDRVYYPDSLGKIGGTNERFEENGRRQHRALPCE